MAREFAHGSLGLADTEIARLLEGGERVIDACYGLFIGVDVEVANRVVDELRLSVISSCIKRQ
jgi:hypothetical protein